MPACCYFGAHPFCCLWVNSAICSAAQDYLGVLPNSSPVKICIQELLDRSNKGIVKEYHAPDHQLCQYITKAMELPASEQADFKAALLHKKYQESDVLYELAEPSILARLYELAKDYVLFEVAIKITVAVAVIYSIDLLCRRPDAPVARTDNDHDLDDGYLSGGDSGGYGSDGYGGYDSD